VRETVAVHLALHSLPIFQWGAEEQERLRVAVRDQAGDGRHEWFKSTQRFDSQYHRDQHGFPALG